ITSCNKTCGSSPKKTKEEYESGSEPPKVGHCQPTTAFSEHRLDANNLFTDGEKEFLTHKDERRASEEKKPKALKRRVIKFFSWVARHCCCRPKTKE
ncbi:unnamed protein product, partial [Porites lobata]